MGEQAEADDGRPRDVLGTVAGEPAREDERADEGRADQQRDEYEELSCNEDDGSSCQRRDGRRKDRRPRAQTTTGMPARVASSRISNAARWAVTSVRGGRPARRTVTSQRASFELRQIFAPPGGFP